MKTIKRLIAAMTALVLIFIMASCGDSGTEPKNAKEASAMHEKLLEQENEILSENSALWEKVFMAADKGMVMTEDGKNYGDFLITTIENAKSQFSDDEYTLIKGEAEKIRDIETKLTELENKFPEINGSSGDDSMSMPAGNANITKFPSFTGKDLDIQGDDPFGVYEYQDSAEEDPAEETGDSSDSTSEETPAAQQSIPDPEVSIWDF